jgi:ankyrin repeat protein
MLSLTLTSYSHAAPPHHLTKQQQQRLDRQFCKAIDESNKARARQLIARGAKVRAISSDSFIDMCYTGDTEGGYHPFWRVRLLAEHGFNVNCHGTDGFTPLMAAASTESIDALNLLLRHGARMGTRNSYGRTALMTAAFALGEGGYYSNPRAVHVLLAHGAKPNDVDNKGYTALILAAGVGGAEDEFAAKAGAVARDLIHHGAAVNAKDKKGCTALMAAAHSAGQDGLPTCLPKFALMLVNNGARSNETDKLGYTALMYLAQLNDSIDTENDKTAVVFARELIRHGADISLKNRYGHTARDIARVNHLKGLIGLLEGEQAPKHAAK